VLRQISKKTTTLGISSFQKQQNHHYFTGTPMETKKKHWTCFYITSLATDKSPTDDQLMGIMGQF